MLKYTLKEESLFHSRQKMYNKCQVFTVRVVFISSLIVNFVVFYHVYGNFMVIVFIFNLLYSNFSNTRLFLLKDYPCQFQHWHSQNRTAKNNTGSQ